MAQRNAHNVRIWFKSIRFMYFSVICTDKAKANKIAIGALIIPCNGIIYIYASTHIS